MADDFYEFMKKVEETTKEKRTVHRKPVVEILYLHRRIDPFLYALHTHRNFLDLWLKHDGLLVSYARLPESFSGTTIKVNGHEIHYPDRALAMRAAAKRFWSVAYDARAFVHDIEKFRKESKRYLKGMGLLEIRESADRILREFLAECAPMQRAMERFLELVATLSKRINRHAGGKFGQHPYLDDDERATLKELAEQMHTRWMNLDAWTARAGRLKKEFYLTNRVISLEFTLLKKVDDDERLLNERLLHLEDCGRKLLNGDVMISYKLYNFIRKDWFTGVVNRVTHSAATHAGIYWKGKVAEARQKGSNVRLNDLHNNKNELLIILRPKQFGPSDEHKLGERIEEYCKEVDGKPTYGYNWKGLAALMVARKHRWFSAFIPAHKAFFCSEFVARAFQDIGIRLTVHDDARMASPKDLLESKQLQFMYVLDTTVRLGQYAIQEQQFKDQVSQLKKILQEKMVAMQY